MTGVTYHHSGRHSFDSVDADSLTDEKDGGAWETLREAGYEIGDVVAFPVATNATRTVSTTNTSFSSTLDLGLFWAKWADILPVNSPQAAMSVEFNAGSGETPSGRFRNQDDGETLASVTGTSGSRTEEWSGFSAYTPTTTTSVLQIQYEHKTDTGTNSITSVNPTLWLGVKI